MHIVLFRHAEREPMRATNPPLTAQGMRQAQALAVLVKQGGLPTPTRLLVSPKLRTQQTFTPLSEILGLDFALCPDLTELHDGEPRKHMSERIQKFISYLEKQSGVIFLCSHFDWIEEFLIQVPCDQDLFRYGSWAPGQYMVFEIQEGLWHLEKHGRIDADS